MKYLIRLSTACTALLFTTAGAATQSPPRVTPMTPDVVETYERILPSADYIRRETMVPMRDGVKLFTVVVMKKGVANAPILLSRTPYSASSSTHRVKSQRIVDILEVMDAEFVNDGKRYTAMRFESPDGDVSYYSADGRPLKKSFLRTPVDFTRISSTFGLRKHPILGYMRAHKGVDYAAPMGTPIYAAGDGVIKFRGQKHGYGNFVIVQHNAHISTAYGHMSRFAANERVGEHVRQGQIIGYVGMTGMATGPHLHYEFRVDDVQRNPLTVTLPKPEPLSGKLMAQFRAQNAPLLARIQMVDDNRRLASAARNDNHNLD